VIALVFVTYYLESYDVPTIVVFVFLHIESSTSNSYREGGSTSNAKWWVL